MAVTVMRGHVGDVIFWFVDGRAVGLWLYREWIGPTLQPGVEYKLQGG